MSAVGTSLEAIAVSIGIAAAGGAVTMWLFAPRRRFGPRPLPPRDASLARLRLHFIDLVAFVLATSGAVTLIPEAVQAFAPELLAGSSIAGTAVEHLDYVAFVLVSLSVGIGLARRLLVIALERAILAPCP